MALISMTGFGRGEASAAGVRVEVELSSVNRKQFDVRLTLPRALGVLESRVYEAIHGSVRRGYIQGAVKVSAANGAARRGLVDTAAAQDYVRALRRAARELGLPDDLSARMLVSLPEVVRPATSSEDVERVWPLLKRALAQALRELRTMEAAEGRALEQDILGRLARLEKRLEHIRRLAPTVVHRYREGLRKRLAEARVQVEGDAALWKEIVVFTDRCDISEETTRLASHFVQARKLFRSAEPVGRTLDFLCQEMFREINTIGSKANDAGIAEHVVHFKTGLESIREQVQNVE